MRHICPFCGITKRRISDIKLHIGDSANKCFYWSLWSRDHDRV